MGIRQTLRLRIAALVCALAAAFVHPVSSEAAESPPASDFFRYAKLRDVRMSPSGRHLAAIVPVAATSRMGLAVIDVQDYGRSVLVANFNDADVYGPQWVNDDRLVFKVWDEGSDASLQPGPGLFAVDREGKQVPRRLIEGDFPRRSTGSAIVSRVLPASYALESVLRDGSNDVVVRQYNWSGLGEVSSIALHRLDTTSGIARLVTPGAPSGAVQFALDASGEPRALVTGAEGKSSLYWKSTRESSWVWVRDFQTYGEVQPPALIRVDRDDKLYLVDVVESGRDTSALAAIDLKRANAQAEPVVSLAGYDFNGWLVFGRRGGLKGVHFLTDARSSHWFDPKLLRIQQDIDRLLPATSNRLDCGTCDDPSKVLVRAESDRQPPVYYLFDIEKTSLELVGETEPWIDAKAMASMEFVRFSARDGLSIPMMVTKPPNAKSPAPTVVLVHAWPYSRGSEWGWNALAQFLASRGYLVLQPEYRGGTGFGRRHFRAGWKQWGLAMSDDLVDAVRWSVKAGLSDPSRVCIAGGSYGGYAVMMALIKDPDVFRCGVQWGGITDIDLLYSIHRSSLSEVWRSYGMPVLVADREKDAAQIAATSPLRQASRLKQPLLMAYGGQNRIVPIEHGTRMRDALKGHNSQVEWIAYPGESNDFYLEANVIDFWTRVEKFLAKHL